MKCIHEAFEAEENKRHAGYIVSIQCSLMLSEIESSDFFESRSPKVKKIFHEM